MTTASAPASHSIAKDQRALLLVDCLQLVHREKVYKNDISSKAFMLGGQKA